jgi:acetoin utilization deacetylase AcuC-like enzyme
MRVFYDKRQALHSPARELHNGDWAPYADTPERALSVVASCGPALTAKDYGLEPILAVHDQEYVEFLREAHDLWRATGRPGDALGYTFPLIGRRKLPLERIDARLGAHSIDVVTPVAMGTWESSYWSVQTALTALEEVGSSRRYAFACCRPPGHHAGRDYMGGYCYLNSAAIAARQAEAMGLGPVALLDIDYHHGNGSQDIFLNDPAVFFASIHADPVTDYPFYWGHADERGEGEGAGTTLNIPLPRGTTWNEYSPALRTALDAVADWGAAMLVVSFGADTYSGDPISYFDLQQEDFGRLAAAIAGLRLPTLIVLEGGYEVDALGANVATFLSSFQEAYPTQAAF